MTMLYSFHENLELGEEEMHFDFIPSSANQSQINKGEIHIFAEKLCAPVFENQMPRPRLNELLRNSMKQFGATLINGRAGTGKTALASGFAREYEQNSWYSIDSSESDWEVFSKYFAASLNLKNPADKISELTDTDFKNPLEEVAYFTEVLIGKTSEIHRNRQHLLVLDDIHYLFDSNWFTAFFNSLLYSLPRNIHLFMLCRGAPSLPLWRLRSKQILGVIDEKVLNFNSLESQELLGKFEIPGKIAQRLYIESFGRISKLKQLAESYSDK